MVCPGERAPNRGRSSAGTSTMRDPAAALFSTADREQDRLRPPRQALARHPSRDFGLQRSGSLVERRVEPHAPDPTNRRADTNGTHEPSRGASETCVLPLNRRMPTGTSGGVRAGGG
jgi:hypothetical protein